jgi:biopolymer transport protein ExbD
MLSRRLPMLLAVSMTACTGADEREDVLDRVTQLEEQLTTARNDVMRLRRRVDELEQGRATSVVAALPEVAIELPRARAADADADIRPVAALTVTESVLVLDGSVITDAELDDALRERARANPDAGFILMADAAVSYARVVELLDRAKSAGLTRISLATAQEGEPPEPAPE